ncbi:MAG: T9SS type A sorting domain-containing protein [Candidatus Delongbacteria bacterium]|nr:T9SS type A sorting domain-containing protein [Candidatus Delongbacteria bacterium]
MRITAVIAGCLLLSMTAGAMLDDYYHNYEECFTLLDSLAQANPDIMRVDSIGYSDQLGLPIWAAVISDNVQENEDEPSLLLTGTCHAEEILGTEIVLSFAIELMAHRNQMPWVAWIATSQIIIVPTYNPEGMGIVLSEQDITYRKNLREIAGDCIIHPGIGSDSCGVDLNRNYEYFWNQGDTLWHDQDAEAFDYYRGVAPFSEGESRAIRDLGEDYNLVYYIAYHSARTSTNFQKVIYPWGWKHPEDEQIFKPCPDLDLMVSLGGSLAGEIPTLDGTSTYSPVLGGGRKGSAHNYSYGSWGTISFLLEVGTNEDGGAFQPQDFAIINQVVDDNLQGVHWIMNRLIGYQVPASMLQGHITDASTGQPLQARVEITEHSSNEIKPRMSRLPYGRFYRVLEAGSYQVRITKPGYQIYEQTLLVNPQEPSNYEIQLEPLPHWTVSGTTFLTSDEETLASCELRFHDLIHDTLYYCISDGNYTLELPEGEYVVTTWHDDYVLARRHLQVDANLESNFGLPDNVITADLSPTTLDDWTSSGENADWTIMQDDSTSVHLVSNSSVYTHSDVDASLTLSEPLDLGSYHHASLHLQHFIDLEDDFDYAEIQASSDGNQWTTLALFTGHWGGYKATAHSLDQFAGGNLYLRFHLVTDDWINDFGWHINSVTVRQSDQLNAVPVDFTQPQRFALLGNYPNPFNPRTTVIFEVPARLAGLRPQLEIYNLLGARVALLAGEPVASGQESMRWRADPTLPSGIYFFQVQLGAERTATGKMLFVK